MPITLIPDIVVTVDPPPIPTIQVSPPAAPSVTLVPVVGPPGPQGPAGTSGVSTNASCVWPQSTPTYLVQVVHNLGFYPAGITAIDTAGDAVEFANVVYPSTSITEVSFDVLFSGTIYLS